MSNQWVINWLGIDYHRWSMSNLWLIDEKKFCGLSITHWCHRLPIDVIDYSSMLLITHWLPIDYSSITHWLLILYHVAQPLQLIANFQFLFLLWLPFLAQILVLNSSRWLNSCQRRVVKYRWKYNHDKQSMTSMSNRCNQWTNRCRKILWPIN